MRTINWKASLRILGTFSFCLMAACTDGRQPSGGVAPVDFANLSGPPQQLLAVSELRYSIQNQEVNTPAKQMTFSDNTLMFTGAPVGLATIPTDGDPEHPSGFDWVLRENLGISSQTSAVFPSWDLTRNASSAMAATNNLIFTSGTFGMSVFDSSDSFHIHEIRRYPPPDATTFGPVQDEAFVYNAIVLDPQRPYLYGFRRDDWALSWKMVGPDIDPNVPARADGSPGNPTLMWYKGNHSKMCCVTGAVPFGNNIYVSFTSRLVSLQMMGDGTLGHGQQFNQIQAQNVYATADRLYVHHRASYSFPQGQNTPTGIYVFDTSGRNIGYLKTDPIRFAVSPDNSHLYANLEDSAITVYRILWSQY